jgi:hypothetical protein
MIIRKLVSIISVLVILGGISIVLHTILSAPSGVEIYWQQLVIFSLPAFVVVLLLLINFKITGSTYQWLLLTVIIALGVLSFFASVVRITSAISLLAFLSLFIVDRKRNEIKNVTNK